jgi:PhnB protein
MDPINEIGSGSHKPPGWHTVTPKIVVKNAAGLTEFIRQVFEATGDYLLDRPSVIKIGDSIIMVGEAGIRAETTAFLYVYVEDTDATYQRALDADAKSVEKPFDTPYGDRRCMVEDKWGNIWQIATYRT